MSPVRCILHFAHFWRIENARQNIDKLDATTRLCSSIFSSTSPERNAQSEFPNFKFAIELVRSTVDNDYLALNFYRFPGNYALSNKYFHICLSIVDENLDDIMFTDINLTGTTNYVTGIQLCDLFRNADFLIIENTITIACRVELECPQEWQVQSTTPDLFQTSKNKVLEDFGELLRSGSQTDVTIHVEGGHELKAHKAVLAARMPFLAESLESVVQGNGWSMLQYPGLKVHIVKEFLDYVYTGKVAGMPEQICELSHISKFQLQLLKDIDGQANDCYVTGSITKGMLSFSYSWTITGFSKMCFAGINLVSPLFPMPFVQDAGVQFVMTICLTSQWLTVSLCFAPNSGYFEAYLTCNLSLYNTTRQNHFYKNVYYCKTNRNQILSANVLFDEVLFTFNDLIVVCMINLYDTIEVESNQHQLTKHSNEKVLCDYGKMLKMMKYHDLTIEVADGQKLHAHKAVLEARIPGFSEMITNKTIFYEIKKPVIEKLLEYIYTGSIADLTDVASDLLLLSKKFKLDCLTDMCKTTLLAPLVGARNEFQPNEK